ncbi:hypothetical protein V6Z12_D04G108400 [Gossypium hirsutum]
MSIRSNAVSLKHLILIKYQKEEVNFYMDFTCVACTVPLGFLAPAPSVVTPVQYFIYWGSAMSCDLQPSPFALAESPILPLVFYFNRNLSHTTLSLFIAISVFLSICECKKCVPMRLPLLILSMIPTESLLPFLFSA